MTNKREEKVIKCKCGTVMIIPQSQIFALAKAVCPNPNCKVVFIPVGE